ncbi:MAG: bifunctional riboflavin kinase/FAD synthetase [Nitrospirae bacterium]|nr:bifunctional riboflavin kinase/FAD synthetase [Nitrospirota bacterium]
MKIYRKIKNFKREFKRPIITIGNFDGVHLGHQAILKKIISRAKKTGGNSVVLTFEPHPVKVVSPHKDIRLITSCEERAKFLSEAGVDAVICVNFTKEFSEQHPDDFARDILFNKIGAAEVYVGHDYAFGKGREGTIEYLRDLGERYGFHVDVIEPIMVNGAIVSSSRIRELIAKGNVDAAARFLGRYYTLSGVVIKGAGRGKDLGFPTANIEPPAELIPKDGVYAVIVKKGKDVYNGVANVGNKPTFGNEKLGIEAYLFDFDKNLYKKRLEISFIKRLRDEIAFKNPAELIASLKKDVRKAKEILKKA